MRKHWCRPYQAYQIWAAVLRDMKMISARSSLAVTQAYILYCTKQDVPVSRERVLAHKREYSVGVSLFPKRQRTRGSASVTKGTLRLLVDSHRRRTAGLGNNFTCLSNASLVRRDCRAGSASLRDQGASSSKRDLPTSYIRCDLYENEKDSWSSKHTRD